VQSLNSKLNEVSYIRRSLEEITSPYMIRSIYCQIFSNVSGTLQFVGVEIMGLVNVYHVDRYYNILHYTHSDFFINTPSCMVH
jgi:hypothetical protein